MFSQSETPPNQITIAFEGGMASGKSTLSDLLHRELGGVFVSEYAEFVSAEQQLVVSQLLPEERINVFLRVEEQRIVRSRNAITRILDRSILTILAFEFSCFRMNLNRIPNGIEKTFMEYSVAIPSIVFYLDVNEKIRSQRLGTRSIRAKVSFLESPEFNYFIKMFFEYAKKHIPVFRLDTTNDDPNRLISICKSKLASFTPRTDPDVVIQKIIRDAFSS